MEAGTAAPRAGRDRLSELPDCLLHSVLSSLRSRQVAQSCLLSRHLWRSVPCLDVDQRDFLLDEPELEEPGLYAADADWNEYYEAKKERFDRGIKQRRSFEDFADAMLLFHGASPLDACGLYVADGDLPTGLHRWIRRGLARHPAELRVACDFKSHDLWFSFELASGGASALPPVTSRLRRLHLSGITLSDELAEELTSQCPVLQDLKLVNCAYYKFRGRIASRSLKRLDIEGCYSYSTFTSLIALALPALVSLKLHNILLPEIQDDLPTLAVASVTESNERCVSGCRFLKSLRNATVLELRTFTTTELLEKETQEFREFYNLRTLILIECNIGDRCQVLRYILENVPNLERLVLQDCEISGHCSGESASSWCGTAFHGCKNLKSIRVKYKNHDVPYVLVDVLTQIAKDVAKTHPGKRNYVSWLDWMGRVIGWEKKFLTQRHAAASTGAESDNSLSEEEEHQSRVRKHRAGKKHDRDYAIKARRRAAHLARR